jgi:hypothetical protein
VGEGAGRGGSAPPATIYGGALGELDQIDQAVYGVHYPGDVLVGSLLGTGAAVAVRYTSLALTPRRARRQRPSGSAFGSESSSRHSTPLSAT